MSDDPTIQPEAAPEPSGPDWSAFEQAGITPDRLDEVQNAVNMARGLQNLDTRGQYLQQIVNPQYDGQFLRQIVEGPQEPPDPWAHLRGDDAPDDDTYAYEPQAPAFDPSVLPEVLDPVLQQYGQQIEQRVFERLNGMAAEQHVKETSTSAVKSAGLPPEMAEMVEMRVRQVQQTQPQRQAGDIANEVASQLKSSLMGWAAAPPANPAPTTPVPQGQVPSQREVPKNFDDLARIKAAELRGG